jgi:hypothetical protein
MKIAAGLFAIVVLLLSADALLPNTATAAPSARCAAMCRNWCAKNGRDQTLCNDRCQVRRCT